MKLKSIEIAGFKSFADRVSIKLPMGVTAVVGPNGCGKTNVIESVRWVLGEQNARMLRGERMDEVIFNGSHKRKPLGMAEVKLNFDDPEHSMGFETPNVSIGRQIFRSGESVYTINNNPCKLRDIQELFMDTGLGSHAYSMIEQKMVDAVLSDKNEERRFLFEEAAGITKYKQRRKVALRRLEATDNDLLRIKDIVAEVQRAVNSLSRQVGKARRYKKLSEKLYRVAVTVARAEFEELEKRAVPLREQKDQVNNSLAEAMASEDTVGAEYENLRKELLEKEKAAQEIFRALGEINSKIRDAENGLSSVREKRGADNEWIKAGGERVQSLVATIERRDGDLKEALSQRENLGSTVATEEGEYKAASAAADEQAKILNEWRRKVEELEKSRSELSSRQASLESRAGTMDESSARALVRSGELEKAIEEMRVKAAELGREKSGVESEKNDIQTNLDKISNDHQELEKLFEEIQLARREKADELSSVKNRLDNFRGERRVLERLQKEMEGYQEGVRRLFAADHKKEGLEAVAAEVFATSPQYEKAIEAAMGARLQCVVTSNTGTMLEAIEELREAEAGSAAFVARDLVNGYRPSREGLPENDEVVAWCEDVVECEENYDFLRKLIFSQVAIVPDLSSAITLQKKAHRPLNLVTLDGETISNYTVSGGRKQSGTESAEGTLLRRKRRIEEIDKRSAELDKQSTVLAGEVEKLDHEIGKVKNELVEKKSAVRELEQSLAGLSQRLMRSGLEIENINERIERSQRESLSEKERSEKLLKDKAEMIAGAEESTSRLKELDAALEDSRDQRQKQESVGARATGIKQEVSLRLTADKARLEALDEKIRLMEQEKKNAVGEKEQIESQIEQRRKSLLELDGREKELRTNLEELIEKRSEFYSKRTAHEQETQALKETATEQESRIKQVRSTREAANENRHRLEMELERMTGQRESLINRIKDTYHLDITGLPEDFEFYPNAEDEKDDDGPANAEMVEELKEKINKLGPVNVLAIEEYEEQKERLDFLTAQCDDLNSAKGDLLELISEINKTARERFLDTFNRVQDNFQEIFSRLFEGGQAHIQLADPDDPLESTIEVTARPRGKKPLHLGLLSGGEKALTALSLLFAIYSEKPSPFCILDEVDAPLDDANIDRFISIIHTFSENTQFVMVTHNKRTMECADSLYGITMQEAGVSKVVSVRLDQVGSDGTLNVDKTEQADVG